MAFLGEPERSGRERLTKEVTKEAALPHLIFVQTVDAKSR
jgi:hypothetical protein